MKQLISCCAISLIVAVTACSDQATLPLTPTAQAKVASSSSGGTPVTATIADADLTIASALQVQSDQLGAYKNSNTLTSAIQDIGAWLLDSYTPRNSSRRVYLEFSQPIAGSGPNGGNPIAVPSALYKVRAIAKCNLLGTSVLTLAPGATMPCPLHVKFDFNGSSYAVQMNPGASAGDPDGNAPETNYVTIACVNPLSGAGPCTGWRITPSGFDGTNYRNIGKLFKYVTSKGKATAVNQGDFYFSFAIGVTNP